MALHVKKGDIVAVIAGDDKGRTGEVLRVFKDRGKVLVQGINRVYKHLRPSRQHPQGGRIQKEMPISLSNVLPLDPKTQQRYWQVLSFYRRWLDGRHPTSQTAPAYLAHLHLTPGGL